MSKGVTHRAIPTIDFSLFVTKLGLMKLSLWQYVLFHGLAQTAGSYLKNLSLFHFRNVRCLSQVLWHGSSYCLPMHKQQILSILTLLKAWAAARNCAGIIGHFVCGMAWGSLAPLICISASEIAFAFSLKILSKLWNSLNSPRNGSGYLTQHP